MVENLKKNDFVEIEFTSKIKGREIFDTNVKEEAKKLNPKAEVVPFVLSIGHEMILKGLDDELVGKEVGKKYTSEFTPEKAFGKRDPKMIRMIPQKSFLAQQINPQPGMQLNLDNMLVKIVSVSGGRVLVDFNNPLAGKTVIYEYKALRKVEDKNEQINALQGFFFRKKFDFELKDKEITFKVDKGVSKYIELLSKPFKDILGLEVKTIEAAKEVKKEEEKTVAK